MSIIKLHENTYLETTKLPRYPVLKKLPSIGGIGGALNPIQELSVFTNETASLSPSITLQNASIKKVSPSSGINFYTEKTEFSTSQNRNLSSCDTSNNNGNFSNQIHRSVKQCAFMATAVATCTEDHHDIRQSDSQKMHSKYEFLRNNQARVGGFTSFSNDNGDEAPLRIRELLVNWSENTTMHGVKFLLERSDIKLRRYLWFLFVLFGIIFMVVLIGERIYHFYQHPITVNVEINYNSTIVFPAITICNQNSFRITKANKHDFYTTLIHIYQHGNLSEESQNYTKTLNTSMEDIYNLTSFQIEEMLIKCTWNGVHCDASNFSRVVTEQGICFGFNHNQYLNVSDTGSANGLSLLLDVHQYEYMPGPIASAGVRFLLHEASTYPRVMDLGEAAPTGTHTYIGAKVTVSSYLTPPYGLCSNETQLEYYSSYNQHNCRIECEAKYMIKECKCRPFFMPQLSNASVCTLYEHNHCFLQKKSEFKAAENKLCKYCDPLPCVSTVYEPSLSYASISKYVLDKLTSDDKINKRFVKTRDIASHVVYELRQKNIDLATNILNSNSDLREILLVEARTILHNDEQLLQSMRLFHKNALLQKMKATQFQMEIVNKDFVRGVESADERTLSLVSHQLFEFYILYKSHVKHLQEVPLARDQERSAILYKARLQLKTRRLCAVAAHQKIKELFNCYRNAQPYWPNQTSGNFSVEEGLSAIPAALLRSSLNSTYTQRKYGNRMLNDLAMLNLTYTKMDEVLRFVMLNGNKSLPSHLNLTQISEQYFTYTKNWYDDRGNYLPDAFYFPLHEMKRRLTQLKETKKKLHDFFIDIELNNLPIRKGINDLEHHWLQFDRLMNLTNLFRNHLITFDAKQPIEHKSTLSYWVQKNTHRLERFERKITIMSSLLKKHLFENQPILKKLKDRLKKMWSDIITDEDSWSYYRFKNWNWINYTVDAFSQEMERNFTQYEEASDFGSIIGDKDRVFINHFQQFTKDLMIYYEENLINENFFKSNLLKLDFFFREMSFEKIVQQKAYKISALMGDIGGMLGLFIGASFLTILEIFDFLGQIIFQAHRKQRSRKNKQTLCIKNKEATSI